VRSWGVALLLLAVGCAGAVPSRQASMARSARCNHCSDSLPEPRPEWTLYGQVLARRSRMPVADALVVAREVASRITARYRTNAFGQFHFASLPPGRYEVVVISGASEDTWPDVIVEPGRRTALTISTAPDEI
jgi:hypothetical protein